MVDDDCFVRTRAAWAAAWVEFVFLSSMICLPAQIILFDAANTYEQKGMMRRYLFVVGESTCYIVVGFAQDDELLSLVYI